MVLIARRGMSIKEIASKIREGKVKLELTIHPDHPVVKVLNTSSEELRLWELDNSWGWFAFSIEIIGEVHQESRIIRRGLREWTKNGPVYFTLVPGESRTISLRLKDGWWDLPEDIAKLKDEPLSVLARYEVASTPEARQYDVFVGSVVSNRVISEPPHGWLFQAGAPGQK